ncbi:hypothetical protein [Raoultella terrigena]|uniref:hypothetical protein n=1 Tax=Raoultella terrigena TaxID=577 RepID=UPI0011D1AA10|nr:hypothetical protein [Raoultella terrigena]
MTDINEVSRWEDTISLLLRADKVEGGLYGAANRAPKELANRTRWLKDALESLSDYREYTFTTTAEDPDGTIAGLAATPAGKTFRVALGPVNDVAFNYYLNNEGVALLVAALPGMEKINQIINLIDLLYANVSSRGSETEDSLNKCLVISNQLALAIRSLFQLSSTSIAASGDTALILDGISAIFFDAATNTDPAAIRHIKIISAAITWLDILLLPGESLNGGTRSSAYRQKDFSDMQATNFFEEESVVRVRFITSLSNQTLTTDRCNVFDKTGRWAAVTQEAAGAVVSRSVSSHSAGGIQLMLPKQEITDAGYSLTLDSVRRYIAEKLGRLTFWYKTSVTLTSDIISFAVLPAGAATVSAGTGVTISAAVYVPADLSAIETNRRMITREALSRKVADFQELTGVRLLEDSALMLPEDSAIELRSLATTTNVNTSFSRMVLSSNGAEVGAFVLPGTATQYSQGKFWSAYRLFTFNDLTFKSILETTSTLIRIRYDLPAGFGVPVAGANYIALDVSGKFAPAMTGAVNAVTRKSIAGTAIANAIQFVIPLAELLAAGYTAATATEYLKSIASDCLFAGYTAYDTTLAQTGFEDYFRLLLPAGDYTVTLEGFTVSGLPVLPAGSYAIWRRKVVRPVQVGHYLRKSADVKNLLSAEYKNYPVELKVSFMPGQVPDSDALRVMDADGNVFDCQFADNAYPNPRLKSNTGYHADDSLGAGSVFITDTLSPGQQKYYELRAYNRRRQDLTSESFPQLVRVADGFTVNVGGYVYYFQRQNSLELTSITDPAGRTHSFAHSCYCTGIVSGASSSNQMVLGASLRMVNTGSVFTELELTVRNRAIGTLAEGALQSTVRYRIFKNGKVLIRVITTATQDIPVGALFGVYSRLNLNDAAYTIDATRALTYWTDSVTGKRFTAAVVFANGDIHRDDVTYGPKRPIRATALQPTGTTTRLDAGWLFVELTDYSFLNWPVPKNWTWTHETWIDCDNTLTGTDSAVNALIVSQANNRPVGFLGECSYAGTLRLEMLEKIACHVRGSVEWWKSGDAIVYGGGPDVKTQFYCHMAEIFLLEKYGISTLNTVYANFKTYMTEFGGITNPGSMFTGGWWGLQFMSRLSIPCYEWLYKMAVNAGDAAKITELKAGIKSLADAVMVPYNTYGGVALVGTATNSGNSNSNATAMRVLALAIYMGLDTGGTYLAAFNALETFITNSATFMKAENIILDGPSDSTLKSMYLPYMVYATNNYLLACKLLNRTPKFDLVNFILTAANSAGGFSEVDYCISESRRGGANTIAFALLPLFQSARPSAMIAAKSLFGIFETQYGPKPGLPKRFFDFDGSSAAGSTMYDPCFVASTLSDLWLSYQSGL